MLSRTHLTSKYGDFNRMMEAREEHGGFGDVTWNVGPHAGPAPYGKGFSILHVNRNDLLAGRKAGPPDEEHRHAQAIGQQMDRGDVVHVPHVRFKGGVPDIDAKHAGSLHAAGQRGAERVPVLIHKDDLLALHAHVGGDGAVAYGGPGRGQVAGDKYRWNGRGWYSKPSFNKGRCPQGSKADLGNDKCIGGGDAPARDPGKRIPSALFGPDSLPPSRRGKAPAAGVGGGGAAAAPAPAPAAGRSVRPRPAAPPAAPPAPSGGHTNMGSPVVHDNLDRSPLGGAPHPVGGGFDPRLMHSRMDTSIGGHGRDDVKLTREPGDTPEITASKKSITDAVAEVARNNPSVKMGEFYGAGAAGAVFAGPENNGLPTVFKVDKGAYEARMADAVLKAGVKNPSLPLYKKVFPTSVRTPDGYPLWVIHREDLKDAEKHLSRREMSAIGWHGGGFGGWLSQDVSGAGQSGGRKKALKVFDNGIGQHRSNAARAGGEYAKQFPRLEKNIRDLIKNGLVPCDLHEGNWGVRPSTGEIVMRDVGCAHVLSK